MAPARPMLDDVELQQVQEIEVAEDQVLVQHAVPALEGDFFQGLARRGTAVTLTGVLTGAEVADGLKKLRDKFRAAAPVPFVADITTATRVEQVLIEEMGVRELAGKPQRFEYAFTLREYIPPPAPEIEPPPPERRPEQPSVDTGTLIVEVTVERRPSFDYSQVTVTVEGTQDDGVSLSRTMAGREGNEWKDEAMPPGQYTATAVVTDPEPLSGSASGRVRAGRETTLRITLHPGAVIARMFLVHFWFDKAFIHPCMRAVLRQVAQYAADHPDEKLLIVGHTDFVGDRPPVEPLYNQSLSERRGRSVFAYLTFGHDQAGALAEWDQLRRRRTAHGRRSINDRWGTREYQHMLQDLGYYPANVDGDHGPRTDAAVRTFQGDKGLTVDGIVGDQTWSALIEAYLSQDSLVVPEGQFLPNCEGEILKWLGCGEQDPVRNTEEAWRPNRRTELLFVRAERLPCEVAQPDTFELPAPGAVNNAWCLGPGDTNARCCFVTHDGEEQSKWLVQPAEPGEIPVRGRITFEDGTPLANARYVLIAPDGECMDGEQASGPSRGRTDASGAFDYGSRTKGIGIYTLEIAGPYVARVAGEPLENAKGNVVCKRLDGSSDFDVVVTDRAVINVRPSITLATPTVVVKKPYANPKRQTVTLRANSPFTGSGTLTRSNDNIRFFTSAVGGIEITFDGVDNVFTDAQLTAGHTIYAEGARPSTALDDVQLTLTLTVNGQRGLSDTATMTSVELTLDICMSRTAAGVDPAPLPQPPAAAPPVGATPTDKWFGGRFVHQQDPGNHHGRALLVVRQVQPANFVGDLVLRQVNYTGDAVSGLDTRVQVFENEFLTSGDPGKGNPFEFNTSTVLPVGRRLWVEGHNISASLRDTGFQLGIKNIEEDGDRVRLTVASFTRLRATIRPTPSNTPANSVAAGIPAPADHTFDAFSPSDNFNVNHPLVLVRNAQPDIRLELTSVPAGLPILWQAIRSPDDHASLGGSGNLPTLTPDATQRQRAQLSADQRGSFRIRAYIDCNSTNTYNAGEPSLPLNLVLADATVVADNSAANEGGNLSATVTAAGVRIRNGLWPVGATLAPADLPAAGMGMELVADVTGGGADGLLGLDRLFAGLVNMVQIRDVVGSYRDTGVAPPTGHRLRFIAASNAGSATGVNGSTPMFQPGDPAPVLFSLPLLDTGRGNPGTGGETATMTRSGAHTVANRPVGQRWTIRCVDSPGIGFPRTHPVNANAVLRQVHYHYQFTACFCFWTNITGNRGATGDPADRVYSALQIVNWQIVGDWDVTFGAPPALTNTTPHRVSVASRTTINPIDRAQDNGIEVRPPSGIQIAVWDGST